MSGIHHTMAIIEMVTIATTEGIATTTEMDIIIKEMVVIIATGIATGATTMADVGTEMTDMIINNGRLSAGEIGP